jgi:hypothetical protein
VVDVLEPGDGLEGTIDLAFRTAAGWTVVEFKTDEGLASHRPEYEAQTAAYVHAIGAATGLPTRGIILQRSLALARRSRRRRARVFQDCTFIGVADEARDAGVACELREERRGLKEPRARHDLPRVPLRLGLLPSARDAPARLLRSSRTKPWEGRVRNGPAPCRTKSQPLDFEDEYFHLLRRGAPGRVRLGCSQEA